MLQNKDLTDEQLVKFGEDFARLNLDDRDDVIFDFEADMKKAMKKVNIKKLIKKDKKYIKNVKNFIMNIVLQRYLIDIIKVGNKKVKRYKKLYLEPAHV